jgi:NAD-dependent SIR2 family protein deacetylase
MHEKLDALEAAAAALCEADALLIGAGAGMGVDSGIPDYRGSDGFWTARPGWESLAQGRWFLEDYEAATEVMTMKARVFERARPHAGYAALRDIAARMHRGVFVYTSNVDSHFERAGFHPDAIMECHGSMRWAQCAEMCTRDVWRAQAPSQPPPECPNCGGHTRPNVLLFGDNMWTSQRHVYQNKRYAEWKQRLEDARVVVLEIGAGQTIPSVREQCEQIAERFGGTHIRLNPFEAEIEGGIGVAMGACAGLTGLAALVAERVSARRP